MTFEQLLCGAQARYHAAPRWQQIAQTLADEIRDRRYLTSGKLPAESELALRFAVNRHTVRQAVAALQGQGLLRVEAGRGAFVAHEWLDYALSSRTRFSENLMRQGFLPSKQLLSAFEQTAPPRVAAELKLAPASKVLMVETLDEANGEPIGVATAYYPVPRFAGLGDMLLQGSSTTEILRHFGIQDYLRTESRITTQMPCDATARLLKQATHRPVLCVECLDVDMNRQPIKFGETLFSGDRVQLLVSDKGAA